MFLDPKSPKKQGNLRKGTFFGAKVTKKTPKPKEKQCFGHSNNQKYNEHLWKGNVFGTKMTKKATKPKERQCFWTQNDRTTRKLTEMQCF